ncbi:MAG: hypothetical protein NT049_05295 [Planctomycetota bacterium]|nr:hypothetical protein [Planctomycetota bacterium]
MNLRALLLRRPWAAAMLAAALLPAAPSPASATAYDLYLLAGQSNMDGRGKAADLIETQRKPFESAVIFYRNPPASSETFKPLAPGYSIAPGYKGGLPSQTFGPEIGFALAMTRAAPAVPLALIKGSKGGTSLSKDWAPGAKGKPDTQGPCYRNFIETVAMATGQLKRDGHTFTLRGLLWHQGESDASSPAEVYEQRLAEFIARVREDLAAPDLPVVVGEVFDNGKRDTVRAALRATPAKVPHTGFASVEGLKTWDAGTHFDAAGQIILGERFAEAMLKLVSAKK